MSPWMNRARLPAVGSRRRAQRSAHSTSGSGAFFVRRYSRSLASTKASCAPSGVVGTSMPAAANSATSMLCIRARISMYCSAMPRRWASSAASATSRVPGTRSMMMPIGSLLMPWTWGTGTPLRSRIRRIAASRSSPG